MATSGIALLICFMGLPMLNALSVVDTTKTELRKAFFAKGAYPFKGCFSKNSLLETDHVSDAETDMSETSPNTCELGKVLQKHNTEKHATECSGHRFRVPAKTETERGPVLCVPQKNGNKNLGGLVHMMVKGKPPLSVEDAVRQHHSYDGTEISNKDEVWIPTRDPYSRLLSLYLQKVEGKCVSGQRGCISKSYAEKVFGHKVNSFEEFAKLLSEKAQQKSLCDIDHHLCTQVSLCKFSHAKTLRAMKLEHMETWYGCLLERMGVKHEQVTGNQWTRFSGQPCFYTPTGNCKDAFSFMHLNSSSVIDHVHGTGASSLVDQYYTPEAAKLVYDLYKDDFEAFDYPKQGGSSVHDFELLPGL